MNTQKPSREVFLLAAEYLTMSIECEWWYVKPRYACVAILMAHRVINYIDGNLDYLKMDLKDTPELVMFTQLFLPTDAAENSPWWPSLENWDHDYESRILALLLCAEMCEAEPESPSLLKRF